MLYLTGVGSNTDWQPILEEHMKIGLPSCVLNRGILWKAGAIPAALVVLCVSAGAQTSEALRVTAEGTIPVGSALAITPPRIPAALLAEVVSGRLQVRQRVAYPSTDDQLSVELFVVPPGTAIPAVSPPGTVLSRVMIRVVNVVSSTTPEPNYTFAGTVASVSDTTLFGDLAGRTAAVLISIPENSTTTITGLQVAVAGAVTTFSVGGAGSAQVTTPPPGGPNQAPIALIATVPNASGVLARQIQLDASGSTDPEGRPLTFSWRSLGKSAAISGSNTAMPTVTFNEGFGEYVFEVTVTDPGGLSTRMQTRVTYIGR
jgi:hypothetical protein